jgi:hypothetical protein
MFLLPLLQERAGVRLKANSAEGNKRLTHLSLRLIKVNVTAKRVKAFLFLILENEKQQQ